MVDTRKKFGVLALQGDFREHLQALEECGVEGIPVRLPEDLKGLRGLIIPGGESTTVGTLLTRWGLDEAIKEAYFQGMALYGTCTGMILLAKEIEGSSQPRLGLMNITVRRNAFGRQVNSFETDLVIPALGDPPLRAVFIRAPVVTQIAPSVEAMAWVEEGIVLVREGRCLASAFHPELTPDRRLHRFFIRLAEEKGEE